MSILDRRPWVRRFLIGGAAGTSAAVALWVIDTSMIAHGISPQGTILDEFAVGALVAGLALLLDLYHEARLRRMREAAKLLVQLNHYVRNPLQVILAANSMQADSHVRQAVSNAIGEIEWVVEKLVHKSELFSDASAYLEKHTELDLAPLLDIPSETRRSNRQA